MKLGEMQILIDYKRSNCYYVFVVAKNMRYYVRPGLAKGLAGGRVRIENGWAIQRGRNRE